jgi:predicted DCC family thiol-disulfide oxidoreductase YuxK
MQPPTDRWAPRPVQDIPEGTVLYDGACVLCSAAFRFVAARDPAARFRFTAVQDPLGRRLALQLGIDPDEPESNAVVVGGMGHIKPTRPWRCWDACRAGPGCGRCATSRAPGATRPTT